ncbi:MAG: PH domain-containing protein [Lachnospiraceae bacterium]|nr:PH domain-containing protein [Lachnospiraceae bacterium]
MEQNRFRCHASVIIENLGGVFWFAVLMLISSMDDLDLGEVLSLLEEGNASAKEVLMIVGIILAIVLVVLAYNWVVWAKTWISIEKEAIVIERNLLNRKVNTIGMKNISNINMEQNIFERIIGTYKIKLDTNSATTADQTDVKIILSKAKAEWFKRQVMQRMNETCEEVNEEAVEYDVQYKAKDIIMHCVYTASPGAVLFCLAFLVGCVVTLNSVNTGAVLLDGIINVLGSLLAVIIVVGSVFQSLVKDFFVYFGFKARRQENKIYLTHGFFKKRQYTIAVDKINAVEIVSSTVSRVLRRQYVKVVCVGVGDEENENSMLLLSEKTDVMKEKLSILLPEFVIGEPTIISRHKKSMWSELLSLLVCFILFGAIAVLLGGMNVLEIEQMWVRVVIVIACIVIWLLVLLADCLSFKTAGIGLEENNLLVVLGTYSKTSTWIPYSKIQEIEYSQGPIARHFGYASGVIYILATMIDSINATSYFDVEVFEQIRAKMLERKGKK